MPSPSDTSTCAWCGERATKTRALEPEKLDPKTKKVIKPARKVDVCDRHAAMIDRDVEIAQVRSRIKARRKRLETTVVRDPEATRRELAYDERRLAELEAA